jgi:hypothetical protein
MIQFSQERGSPAVKYDFGIYTGPVLKSFRWFDVRACWLRVEKGADTNEVHRVLDTSI